MIHLKSIAASIVVLTMCGLAVAPAWPAENRVVTIMSPTSATFVGGGVTTSGSFESTGLVDSLYEELTETGGGPAALERRYEIAQVPAGQHTLRAVGHRVNTSGDNFTVRYALRACTVATSFVTVGTEPCVIDGASVGPAAERSCSVSINLAAKSAVCVQVRDSRRGTDDRTANAVRMNYVAVEVEVASGVCGNGVVEGSEQCDGGSCCTESCTFATSGAVCRAGVGACDVAETCTGSSSSCPIDVFAPDGRPCSGGTCIAGLCIAGNPLLTEDPMVGAVTPGSAKVWTRTSSPALVTVQYSVDPNMQDDVSETSVITTASASDYTAIFSLTGLVASTTYSYRVVANGQAQLPPFPSFRTAPAAGSSEDFGFVVFADLVNVRAYPNDPAPAYYAAASEGPAFFVQIGDFDHRNPQVIKEMRKMHRDVRSWLTAAGRDLSEAILPSLPVYHVWDDHDYGTNNGDKTFVGKAAALQAFKEYYPTPDLANPAAGIWHKFSYAQAEIFMLDLRSQRDPGTDPDVSDKSILEGDPIANGQKQWFKTGLLTSTARWKIVMSSVPFNPGAKPLDSWGAFLAERREILDFICANRITGVIMISGDVHSGGGIDDGTNSGVPELSVPHTNERGGNTGVLGTWSEGIVSGLGNPGYGSIQVLTDPDRVILQAKGQDGTVRKSLTVFPTTAFPATARCQ